MEKKNLKETLSSNKAKAGVLTATLLGAGTAGAVAATVMGDNDGDDIEIVEEGLSVAGGVSDDMSFEDAFEAARAEVGPGGVFHWHGNTYNTYTESEWDSLSDEDRQNFSDRIGDEVNNDSVNNQHHSGHSGGGVQTDAPGPETDPEPVVITEPDTPGPDPTTDPATDPATGNDISHEPTMEVLGIEDVVQDDGSVITVAAASVDGKQAALIDTNHDGTFDVGAIDMNSNGEVDDNEMFDVSAAGYTVDDLAKVNQGETHLLTPTDEPMTNDLTNVTSEDFVPEDDNIAPDMPDYVNDADCFG